MTLYLESGSAIERAMICGSSVALPHSRHETIYTTRGRAIHSFLEACSKVGRDDALVQVDEDYRDVCAELDLSGLHAQLSLAAEVAFAYNYVKKTARELGRGVGRVYDDVTIDELPCTLDVVGVRDVSQFVRRGFYGEFKSGWTTRRKIALVAQIDFGALCIARTYGCDVVEGQHINVHEGLAPYVQRRVIEGWEIDAFESELYEHAMRWRELRDRYEQGVMPREFQTGQWCDRCPSREFCPAISTQVRWALQARDNFDGPLRVQLDSLDDAQFGRLWDDVDDAIGVLTSLRGRMKGIASSRRIKLGTTPDGMERWLGTVISEGNDKLDGEHVFDVVAELHGEEVATAATKITATKKDLEAAIKGVVPRGKKAEALREIYKRLEAVDGAITNKVNVDVKETRTKPALPPGEPEPMTRADFESALQLDSGALTPDDEAALASLSPVRAVDNVADLPDDAA